jgi:hypothetical protein
MTTRAVNPSSLSCTRSRTNPQTHISGGIEISGGQALISADHAFQIQIDNNPGRTRGEARWRITALLPLKARRGGGSQVSPPTLALSLIEKLKVVVDRVPLKCFCCGKTYKNKRSATKHIKNNPCPTLDKLLVEAGKQSTRKNKKGLLPALLTVPLGCRLHQQLNPTIHGRYHAWLPEWRSDSYLCLLLMYLT